HLPKFLLFSESKNSIESTLSRILHTPDPHSNPTLKSELDNVSISIADLEKLVAENSFSLPSYEVRYVRSNPKEEILFQKQINEENHNAKRHHIRSSKCGIKGFSVKGFGFARGNDEEIMEYVLSDLKGCDVRLMGSVRALFVHKLIERVGIVDMEEQSEGREMKNNGGEVIWKI
ncbi:hypothetical protein H5410_011702, partial [Solanum commersonii]